MSVTLTLQDDLAVLLQAEAEEQHQPLPVVAAALLRRALTSRPPGKSPASTPFRVQPHRGTFVTGIRADKLNRLADELDSEAFLGRDAP